MERSPGNGGENTMSNKSFYSFDLENKPHKRHTSLKTIVCMQLLMLAIFIIGFAVGMCIGIFVYHRKDHMSSLSDKNDLANPRTNKPEKSQDNEHIETGSLNEVTTGRIIPAVRNVLTTPTPILSGNQPTPWSSTTTTPLATGTSSTTILPYSRPQKHINGTKSTTFEDVLTSNNHQNYSQHSYHNHDSHLHHGSIISPDVHHGYNSSPETHQGPLILHHEEQFIPLTSSSSLTSETPKPQCKLCFQRSAHRKSRSKKLYSPLTSGEMNLTYNVLREQGIVTFGNGDDFEPKSNFISSIDIAPPVKKEALDFLDLGATFPGRYSLVIVFKGADDPPCVMEYKVGPLDGPTENITVKPLLAEGEIPYHRRPYDIYEMQTLLSFIYDYLESMKELLGDSFDTHDPLNDLNVIPVGPYAMEEGKRITRFSISFKGIGDKDLDFLAALPFTAKVNHESFNVSDWYMFDFYYLNQGPFPNTSYLYTAYYHDMLKKVQFPKGTKDQIKNMNLPKRDEYQPVREGSHYSGPKTFYQSGPRFTIDDHDISWLGWTFSASDTTMRGPSIFNVRFKNERILYENSLNDIALVYGADDPGKDNILYNDCEYGIGNIQTPIIGPECPEHAVLLNISVWEPMKQVPLVKPGICVFEMDKQEALWRHNGKNFNIGLRNRYLVVRYPTTIGNYDYTFDFEFHLDGTMKTTAMATGFIFGSFFDPYTFNYGGSDGKTPFGYKVGSFVTGPIHDHTFAFKVDLDVAGSKNDFERIHWKVGSVEEAVTSRNNESSVPKYFFKNKTRYIVWENIKNETGFRINLENQTFWTVVNNNKKNAWNVSRGYRIIPMASGAQNFQEDYAFYNSIAFSENHCTVTKRKEDEQFLKPIYRYYKSQNSNSSKRYLADMVDGDPIDNDDIVTWLSLGFLHIPTSEDVPITSRVETGFTLKPFNFFDTTATFDVPQYTDIDKKLVDDEPVPPSDCYIKV